MATDQDEIDERFEALLADYHDLLTDGADEAQFWKTVEALPAGLRERLQSAGECVRQLLGVHSDQPGSTQHPDADPTALPLLDLQAVPQPTQIGRFRIKRELGRGGNGVVLLGVDPQLGRRVAIKVPLPEVLVHSELRKRFLREAEIAARLQHPNLLAIHESGESGPVCYIAYEYCSGPNLAEWLREQRAAHPPAMATIVNVMISLADAVQHAHARGVLHRDLKPSNVLLEPLETSPVSSADSDRRGLDLTRYVPKLADFGLAKLVEHDVDHTRTGTVLGTLLYMSPEQAEGRVRDISVQSDVYALGAILYELLTGRPPLRGESDQATFHQILLREPVRPSQSNPGIPRDLEAICLKCLAKLPAERYLTAAELADDLRRHQQGIPTTARPAKALERAAKWVRRRPVIAGLSALLAAALVTMVVGTTVYNAQLARTVTELRVQREIAREHERSAREYAYGADMMLAYEAWERSAPIEAKALLDRHVPAAGEEDFRRLEWYQLHDRFEHTSTVIAHQPTRVWSLAASLDDKLLATGDTEGVIRLWDRERRMLVRELRGHAQGDINQLLFTRDGQHLISAGDDATIRWWDVSSGENTLIWREHTDWVGSLALSPDGAWIVSGGGEGRVLLWNVTTRSLERELYRHSSAVRWIVFSPTQSWLVSASEDGQVRIWDYRANSPPEHISTGELPVPENTEFSWRNAVFHQHGWSVYAGNRQKIYQWDTRPGLAAEEILNVFDSSNDSTLAVGLVPKLNLVLEAGNEIPTLISHRCKAEFGEVHVLAGHTAAIRCLVTLADRATVLSGSEDGDVRQWSPLETELGYNGVKLSQPPRSMRWSPDSDRLWVLAKSGDVLEVDLNTSTLVNRQSLLGDCQKFFTFRDKDHLLGIDSQGRVQIWDGKSRTCNQLRVFDAVPESIVLNAAGDHFAFESNGSLALVAVADGKPRWSRRMESAVEHLQFLRDGSLCVCCDDGIISTLSAADGHESARSLPQRGSIKSLEQSNNGQWIVTASSHNKVRILNAITLQECRTFTRPHTPTGAWFVDQDQRLLVSGSTTVLMHAQTGQELLRIPSVNTRSAVSPNCRWSATLTNESVQWRSLVGE